MKITPEEKQRIMDSLRKLIKANSNASDREIKTLVLEQMCYSVSSAIITEARKK